MTSAVALNIPSVVARLAASNNQNNDATEGTHAVTCFAFHRQRDFSGQVHSLYKFYEPSVTRRKS